MEDLLTAWEISPDTICVFRNNDIDISCLEGLGNEELKILIPDDKIKDRIKFKIGYQRYKDEIATVHSNTDSLDTEDNLSLSSFSDDINSTSTSKSQINLQQVLNNTMHGRQALAAISKNKMDTSARCHLVQTIVDHYIKTYKKMSKSDFEAIASEIVRQCPNECKETYYVPSRTIGNKNTMPAKGKLVDRYYNQLRSLRGSGVLPRKRNRTDSQISDTEGTDYDTADADVENMRWLKFNRDPWPLVEQKWEMTCAYRKRTSYESNNNKLSTILNDWPCLKATNGHRLIKIDFCHSYMDKSNKLLEKWDIFQEKAIKAMENIAAIENDLKQNFTAENENIRDFAVCSSLAYRMKPTSKVMNPDKNKFNKVSIAESKQAFVTHVQNFADIEEELLHRHKSYNKKGLTCQPLIICVGVTYDAFYVVVDDMKYRFDSMTKALDICFKCFMVLNLAYPKECEQIWLFIQQYIYEIHLSSDKKFGQVSNFIKEIVESCISV